MRVVAVLFSFGILLALPPAALAQSGQVQGFGGITFGDVASSSTFGGGIAAPLSDHMQIIGEAGRMNDLAPPLLGTIFDFSPVGLELAAWYGEGGIRVIGSPHQTLRPYAEATAGFARLTTGLRGAGSRADAVTDLGLAFLNSTEPLLGVGGGVIVQGGPVFLDVGYRYKKILSNDTLQSFLNGGDISISQFRIGAGFRF